MGGGIDVGWLWYVSNNWPEYGGSGRTDKRKRV